MTLTDPSPPLSPGDFRRFQSLAYAHAGIRLSDGKVSLVQNRLQRRLRATGIPSFQAYHDLITGPGGTTELQQCIEALTTNETFFFRHKEHWDFFIATILAGWNQARTLRIWSAAASTGEEAHSAAIACLEHAPAVRVAIDASDINASVLATAKQGIYGDYAVQKVTDYARQRWLTRVAGGWQVQDEARRLISWRQHNLLEPVPGTRTYDVVFLRNVLIYFDEASKARVLEQVVARMSEDAHLLLGGSESVPAGFGLVAVRPQIYRRS